MHAKPATPDEDRYLRSERKSKSTSRFLSILNCCSTSEPDNEDPDLPAKRAETRVPAAGRQPPSEKAEVSAAESSTAESKDHQLLNEKTGDSAAHQPHPEETHQEQPNMLPDAEGRSDLAGEYATAPRSEPSNKQPADVPGVPSFGKKDVGGDAIGPESTPGHSQDDRDIAIPDAHIPSSEEEEDPVPTQDVVPPPPQPPPPDVYLPGPPTANGKQNIWLLPPPLPHLDGRKCLILDLDETLVHSSFKVCIHQPN